MNDGTLEHAEPEAVLWHVQQVSLVPGSFSAPEVGSLVAWQQQIQTWLGNNVINFAGIGKTQ